MSDPGIRKSLEHPGKASQGISALPGQAKKTPEFAECLRLSFGNSLLGSAPRGLMVGESPTSSDVLGKRSSVENVVTG